MGQGNPEVIKLKEQIIEIQNKGPLGVGEVHLCSNIQGFGQYVELKENKVPQGSELQVYYEPVNLFTNSRSGVYQLWYTQDMILTTQDGQELLNLPDKLNFNYMTSSPVLDVFATNSINLGELPPGTYIYKIVVHDKLKNQDATKTLTFEIVAAQSQAQ